MTTEVWGRAGQKSEFFLFGSPHLGSQESLGLGNGGVKQGAPGSGVGETGEESSAVEFLALHPRGVLGCCHCILVPSLFR